MSFSLAVALAEHFDAWYPVQNRGSQLTNLVPTPLPPALTRLLTLVSWKPLQIPFYKMLHRGTTVFIISLLGVPLFPFLSFPLGLSYMANRVFGFFHVSFIWNLRGMCYSLSFILTFLLILFFMEFWDSPSFSESENQSSVNNTICLFICLFNGTEHWIQGLTR